MKVKETSPSYLTHKKIYTYQNYLDLPEDGKRYEIINGELIMTPAPITIHQRIHAKIVFELRKYTEKHKVGEVFYAPFDVVLSETNVVQPDILFVSNENANIITDKNISGAPDLVIEILSPTTGYYDLIEKKEIYEKFGVQEYWIVDPKKQWVEIYLNAENKFHLDQHLQQGGVLNSKILKGFEIEFNTIFEIKLR
ncbi:MAG: Uma2 family endonuclease [bacterium]